MTSPWCARVGIHNASATSVEWQALSVSGAAGGGQALLGLDGTLLLAAVADAKGRPAAADTAESAVARGPWAALFDPGFPFGHRRAAFLRDGRRYIPARFAIDWIKLDAQGKPWIGATSRPFESWHGWGQDVLAVADGEIVDLRDGRFAFYEHLQRGSIAVAKGQRVRAGQVIAKLGRSGVNSSGPHLHFHVADAPSTLQAQGRPCVFAGFRPLGRYGSMADAESGRAWTPQPAEAAARVTNELPLPNAVLMFDE